MQDKDIIDITHWLSTRGMEGASFAALIRGFCRRCNAAGLAIAYTATLIDTLNPGFEGSVFEWDVDEPEADGLTQYKFTNEGAALENWTTSVFYHLLETGQQEVRRELAKGVPLDFFRLDEHVAKGHTDYVAMVHRFTEAGSIGEMTCLYSTWTTRNPDGFAEEDLASLRQLLPTLALAVKCVSTVGIVKTVANVYLGHDAGARVISGQIIRGAVESIDAVIWYTDLKNFTAISDQADADQIIPFLNDYAGLVIDAVHRHGGSVLKLMGDGVLAIFRSPDVPSACSDAMDAGAYMRQELVKLNDRRSAKGEPFTGIYHGLHIGRVFFGNIGSRDRLDFTVVGPAVNEASRIAAMCRTTGHDLLVSDDFAAACPPERRAKLQSLGEFVLRGVQDPKQLFTKLT